MTNPRGDGGATPDFSWAYAFGFQLGSYCEKFNGFFYIQGHPERMSKVNPFAWALIFTKSGFSGVFWDEK